MVVGISIDVCQTGKMPYNLRVLAYSDGPGQYFGKRELENFRELGSAKRRPQLSSFSPKTSSFEKEYLQ